MKSMAVLLLSGSFILSSLGFGSPLPSSQTEEVVSKYANGNEEVLKTARSFLSHLHEAGLMETDCLPILEAIQFSAFKHRHQKRKDPNATPYINHPIEVADHLLMIGEVRDPDILIAALLHDTVEDTDTTFDEVKAAFGPRVEGFVREVTDDKLLPKAERKGLQIVNAPHKSPGAAQVKLADKFNNLNSLLNSPPLDWDRERIDAYFDWAEQVVHSLPQVNIHLLNAVDQTIANYRK